MLLFRPDKTHRTMIHAKQRANQSIWLKAMWEVSQGGLVVINLCDPGSTLALGGLWAEFQSISIWLQGFFSG